MSKESLRELLYQKASKEQEVYVEHLKRLPPEHIIDKAYEKVMRDDILMTFEDDYLSDKQIAELIKLDYPLLACYNEWMDTDYSHIGYSISQIPCNKTHIRNKSFRDWHGYKNTF